MTLRADLAVEQEPTNAATPTENPGTEVGETATLRTPQSSDRVAQTMREIPPRSKSVDYMNRR